MQILILQGSPRAKGNTAWMAEEYKNAAEAAGQGEPKNMIPWDKLAEFFNKNLK